MLIVRGEPDVGKSALTVRAAEHMSAAGAVVTSVSLQDTPADTLALETALGGQLVEVLGATATAETRLLVLDGAESVLEGRSVILTELTIAALRAGLGVVAVTREDAAAAVANAMRSAQAAAGAADLREHQVPRLLPGEAEQIATVFPILSGSARTCAQRGCWADPVWWSCCSVHVSPGNCRTGHSRKQTCSRPSGTSSSAAGGEHPPGGPSPEARERAPTSMARTLLLPGGNHTLPDRDRDRHRPSARRGIP